MADTTRSQLLRQCQAPMGLSAGILADVYQLLSKSRCLLTLARPLIHSFGVKHFQLYLIIKLIFFSLPPHLSFVLRRMENYYLNAVSCVVVLSSALFCLCAHSFNRLKILPCTLGSLFIFHCFHCQCHQRRNTHTYFHCSHCSNACLLYLPLHVNTF